MWYIIKIGWLFWVYIIEGIWIESTKLLGMINIPCHHFEKTFTKIVAQAGIDERLVIDSVID